MYALFNNSLLLYYNYHINLFRSVWISLFLAIISIYQTHHNIIFKRSHFLNYIYILFLTKKMVECRFFQSSQELGINEWIRLRIIQYVYLQPSSLLQIFCWYTQSAVKVIFIWRCYLLLEIGYKHSYFNFSAKGNRNFARDTTCDFKPLKGRLWIFSLSEYKNLKFWMSSLQCKCILFLYT